MMYKIVTALAIAGTASAGLYSEDHTVQKSRWENFKMTFGKKYETMEEEARRFYLFVENLRTVDKRNIAEKKAGGSAVHGVTKFSDLSQAEFEAGMLTADKSMKTTNPYVFLTTKKPDAALGEVNWSGKYTTAVKNQGYCGSCWAFSATEQIESDSMRTLGTNFVLSPEQITQCDRTSLGCNGGWTEHAYNYVSRTGGLETNANYPYTSSDGTTGDCHEDSSKFVVKVNGYTTIGGANDEEKESNMAAYMQSTGPLSVCLDAETWNSYTGGIMAVCGQNIDHCVQAVGVDASAGGYWIVRNSWDTTWGEGGYIRLAYGKNTCGITYDATYVSVSNI